MADDAPDNPFSVVRTLTDDERAAIRKMEAKEASFRKIFDELNAGKIRIQKESTDK